MSAMIISQYAAELCTLLIEDQYGDLFARIFSTLQRYERLSLSRLKFYSRLTDRQLQHGLAAMIQHHLVYHFTSLEDGNTYYEANPQAAYYLVRSGKIIRLVENRLGEYAGRIMETILFLGHVSIKHLETLPELRTLKFAIPNGVKTEEMAEESVMDVDGEVDGPVDGPAENPDQTAEDKPAPLHSTLKALASHGYIMRVRDAHFQSPADNFLEARRAVAARSDVKNLKGKRHQETLETKTQELIEERTRGDLSEGLMFNGLPRGIKRKHENGVSGSARTTNGLGQNGINGDHADDEAEEEENDWSEDEDGFDNVPMEAGMIVRVNYEKLDVALRMDRFMAVAALDAPAATAEVYGCLLRRIEYVTKRCRDETEIPREGEEGEQFSIPVEVYKIVDDVDPGLDLSDSIGPLDPAQTVNRRGKRPLENGVNGNHHDDSDDDSGVSRAYEVNQHLKLLEQAPYNLASHVDLSDGIKWRIGFRGLARKMRHLELEQIIMSRYGDVALRVIRVLQAKGKLDEKRLQEISLLPFKDLRQTLASMQSGGFVDLQEVPKDAQRQPSKTIFLWYYDPDRVCGSILDDTYKAMSRTLQRIKFERNLQKDFLEKTERSDVKGNEDRYLSEGELEQLRRWKDREAALLGVVSRLDDLVAIFRDY
ncbi:DNA-directed RNA polymerase III subunit rpc3 [Penicillium macrosclerotiorum]|uniref:DNA-directed RNA polymerase III subunit rpc3 n=1 Tax=Penicillium macrosclerotiorum TaxID=303699 RepID=UPI00254828BE|nr:DNA-directed RNA polymerase III subunit rpc3 [Penicillium macrosclerotiorum]KAJ5698278.1 DNA-directed RNA polymerase III subunit rpc3 [Penicillium macrosclerotiorum]